MQPRTDHVASRLADGRVLLAGGRDTSFTDLASMELWDPGTGEFELAGSLGLGRILHTATRLADGRVLIVGGSGVNEDGMQGLFGAALVWDPESGELVEAGPLAIGRAMHRVSALPDGRVLVIGGIGYTDEAARADPEVGPSLLADVEIFDPAGDTFRPAGRLSAGRLGHTATTLLDGRVLVIGGSDETGQVIGAAEVWAPSPRPARRTPGRLGTHHHPVMVRRRLRRAMSHHGTACSSGRPTRPTPYLSLIHI